MDDERLIRGELGVFNELEWWRERAIRYRTLLERQSYSELRRAIGEEPLSDEELEYKVRWDLESELDDERLASVNLQMLLGDTPNAPDI